MLYGDILGKYTYKILNYGDNKEIEKTMNELAAEGYKYAGAMLSMIIMEKEIKKRWKDCMRHLGNLTGLLNFRGVLTVGESNSMARKSIFFAMECY